MKYLETFSYVVSDPLFFLCMYEKKWSGYMLYPRTISCRKWGSGDKSSLVLDIQRREGNSSTVPPTKDVGVHWRKLEITSQGF